MRMRLKKIFMISVGIFIALTLLLIAGNRLLVRPLSLKVQKKIESFLPDRQVRLGKASTDWFNVFVVSPVEISKLGGFVNGTAARIDSVRLRYRLTDILRKRVHPDESLASITLLNPMVIFEPREPWKFSGGNGGGMPPIEIVLNGGKIDVQDKDPRWNGLSLENINAVLDAKSKNPAIEITAVSPKNEKLHAAGTLENALSFKAEIQIKDFRPGDYAKRFDLLPDTFTLEGTVDAGLKIGGPISSFTLLKSTSETKAADLCKALNAQATLRFKNLSAVVPLQHKEKIELSANGNLKVSGEKIESKDLTLKTEESELKLDGTMESPLMEKTLSGALQGRLGLEDLRKLTGWKSEPENFQGHALVRIFLGGTVSEPKIQASLKMDKAALYRMPLTGEGFVETSTGTVELKAADLKWGDGTLKARGSFSENKIAYSVSVDALTMNPLFIRPTDPNKTALAGGKLTLALSGSGKKSDPIVKGSLKVSDFFWGNDASEKTAISGTFASRKKSIRASVRSSKNQIGLTVLAETLKGVTEFKDCKLSFSPAEYIAFKGKIDHVYETVSGSAQANQISTGRLSPLLGFFSRFEGKISGAGVLSGEIHDPIFKGTLASPLITLRENSEPLGSLKTPIEGSKDGVKLSKIVLGQAVQASFAYSKKDRSMQVKAEMKGADPKLIFAFMDSASDISGKTYGSLALVRRKGADPKNNELAWEGKGEAKIQNGKWGNIDFDALNARYHIEGTKIFFDNFSFLQKEGHLISSGETSQSGEKNPLSVKGSAKNFKVGDSVINGDLAAEGIYRMEDHKEWLEAAAQSSNFRFNKFSAGTLTGKIELKDRVLSLSELVWGEFFRGRGSVAFGQKGSPKIEAEWKSGSKDLSDWNEILPLAGLRVKGKMSLAGKVSGTASAMEHSIASEFKDLKMITKDSASEEIPGFSGSGNAELSASIIKSLTVKASQGDGGSLTILGQINLKTKEVTLDTLFSKVDSALAFGSLGLKNFKGKMDGHLEIQGPFSETVAKGEIKGGEASFGNIALDSWEVSGTFQEKELQFRRINLYGRKNSWRFSVLEDSWIKPKEKKNGSYKLAADFANISLGPVFFVGSGILEGDWRPKENSDNLIFEGTARVNECAANNVEMKPFAVRAGYDDKILRFLPLQESPSTVQGAIDFSGLPCVSLKKISVKDAGKEIFSADGDACPDKPSFVMKGAGVDASVISGVLGSPFVLKGPSDFSLEGFTKNDQPSLAGNISLRGGKIEEIPLDSLNASFSWKNGLFSLASMEAVSSQYFTVTAQGTVPMKWANVEASASGMNLKAECRNGLLAFLNLFELESIKNLKGKFSANFILTGNASSPKIDGKFRVQEGEFDSKYLPRRAKELELNAEIKANRVAIRNTRVSVAGHKILVDGSALTSLESGELNLENMDLRAQNSDGVPILIPQLPAIKEKLGLPPVPSRAEPRFDLRLQGSTAKPKISGWVQLDQALFSYPPPKTERGDHSWLERANYDLELRCGKQTVYQNDYATAHLNGKIKLSGESRDMIVDGKITSNRGSITLFGSRFDLKEAELEIAQSAGIKIGEAAQPAESKNTVYLEFKAEKTAMITSPQGDKIADTITLELLRAPLSGGFDPKKVIFHSAQNPEMTSERVAGRAGLGENLDQLTPEQRDLQLRQGIARLLDSELASPIARSVLGRFGIENVEFSQTNTEDLRNAALRGATKSSSLDALIGQSVLLEKTIFGLGVGYRATFDRIEDKADLIHQLQLRYPFYRGIWLYGSRDLDSEKNLGRNPDTKFGIQGGFRFDPSNWFRKKEDAPSKKP